MYFQTWSWFSRLKYPGTGIVGERKSAPFKFIAIGAEKICGKLLGHEPSKTEIGYSGGKMIGVWCRWCNFHWQIPLSEEPSKEYLKDIFNEDISQGDK